MTALELPPHVATADEPIPAPGERARLRENEPEMRQVTPIEVMLAQLAHVAHDDLAFVRQFRAYVGEIGCSLMAHYHPDGELVLSYGSAVDVQVRHRSRWMFFLVDRLDAVPSRRDVLMEMLVSERVCWDERPRQRQAAPALVGAVG